MRLSSKSVSSEIFRYRKPCAKRKKRIPTTMILSRNHPLRKGDSLVLLLLFLQEQVQECLRLKEDGIIDDATVTVPTVRLTMVTDTVDGIMDMTMFTAANLAVIKVAAVWIKEMRMFGRKKKSPEPIYDVTQKIKKTWRRGTKLVHTTKE